MQIYSSISTIYKRLVIILPRLHLLKHYSRGGEDEYSTLMDLLQNKKLMNCIGELVPAERAFKKRPLMLYYFSASWCAPCKQLLPKLKQVYQESQQRKNGFEIIYVSSDTDEEIMKKYFKEKQGCGWFAVPFGDSANEELRQKFNISYVPEIIVVRISDGFIVSRKGRKDIEDLGINVLVKWNPNSTL